MLHERLADAHAHRDPWPLHGAAASAEASGRRSQQPCLRHGDKACSSRTPTCQGAHARAARCHRHRALRWLRLVPEPRHRAANQNRGRVPGWSRCRHGGDRVRHWGVRGHRQRRADSCTACDSNRAAQAARAHASDRSPTTGHRANSPWVMASARRARRGQHVEIAVLVAYVVA